MLLLKGKQLDAFFSPTSDIGQGRQAPAQTTMHATCHYLFLSIKADQGALPEGRRHGSG